MPGLRSRPTEIFRRFFYGLHKTHHLTRAAQAHHVIQCSKFYLAVHKDPCPQYWRTALLLLLLKVMASRPSEGLHSTYPYHSSVVLHFRHCSGPLSCSGVPIIRHRIPAYTLLRRTNQHLRDIQRRRGRAFPQGTSPWSIHHADMLICCRPHPNFFDMSLNISRGQIWGSCCSTSASPSLAPQIIIIRTNS